MNSPLRDLTDRELHGLSANCPVNGHVYRVKLCMKSYEDIKKSNSSFFWPQWCCRATLSTWSILLISVNWASMSSVWHLFADLWQTPRQLINDHLPTRAATVVHWRNSCDTSCWSSLSVIHSMHQAEKHAKKKCAVCSSKKKRRETAYWCKDCQAALCVVPCFADFHNQSAYNTTTSDTDTD